jgi:3-oxoacyl-[acyl-carrier-protein] synthase II
MSEEPLANICSNRRDEQVKRVVVTGMGVVSPLGNTVHDFWRGLLQGRSGIAALDDIELGKLPTRIGARAVGYDTRDYFDHKEPTG